MNGGPYLPADLRENWQSMQIQQGLLQPQDHIPAFYPPEQELPLNWKPSKLTDIKKNGFHLEEHTEKVQETPPKPNNTIVTTETHPEIAKAKTIHIEHKKHTPVPAELKITDDVEIIEITDGITDRPSGAILSLTLGNLLEQISSL